MMKLLVLLLALFVLVNAQAVHDGNNIAVPISAPIDKYPTTSETKVLPTSSQVKPTCSIIPTVTVVSTLTEKKTVVSTITQKKTVVSTLTEKKTVVSTLTEKKIVTSTVSLAPITITQSPVTTTVQVPTTIKKLVTETVKKLVTVCPTTTTVKPKVSHYTQKGKGNYHYNDKQDH